jgi:general secretion pathway protein K
MNENCFNQKGIALITVILMVVVLVAVVIELNRLSRADIYDAANISDGIQLSYIAKSGVYGAAAILANSPNDYDTLRDDWAKMETISLQSGALFNSGYFIAHIEDETGKIPLNKLVSGSDYNEDVKAMLLRLLLQPEFGLTRSQAEEIVASIKDWIDADDETTPGGAESSFYTALDPPYSTKNAPMDCIEELLMVKGITKELFNGTKERPPLVQLVTVDSDGRININTAPKLVLRSLSDGITPEMADEMDEYRRKEGNNLSDLQWYKRVSGMDAVSMNPDLLTVKGSYFKIVSTGKMNDMNKTITAVVQKADNQSVRVVKWRQD